MQIYKNIKLLSKNTAELIGCNLNIIYSNNFSFIKTYFKSVQLFKLLERKRELNLTCFIVHLFSFFKQKKEKVKDKFDIFYRQKWLI